MSDEELNAMTDEEFESILRAAVKAAQDRAERLN